MTEAILFLIVIFISCFLQGVTGFGFAVLAAPLGFLIYDQKTIVVVLTVISLVLNFFLLKKIKVETNKALVTRLVCAGMVGVPLGVLALTSINPDMLKLGAGILSLTFAIILLSPKNKIQQSSPITLGVGALTGFLQSSIGLSGPPLVLVLTGYGTETKQMRKTLALLFLYLSVFTLPLFLWKNLLTWDRLWLGLIAIPVVIVGGNLGNKVSERVPKPLFRAITLLLVLVASSQVIFSVLSKM